MEEGQQSPGGKGAVQWFADGCQPFDEITALFLIDPRYCSFHARCRFTSHVQCRSEITHQGIRLGETT